METKEIEKILSILRQNEVTEFELTHKDGTQLKLRRGQELHCPPQGMPSYQLPPGMSHPLQPAVAGNFVGEKVGSPQPPQAADDSHLVKVISPIVGTFYKKPSPDANNFVEVGQSVKKGETLCIVEAMKLMNQIESPCSGKIEKILVDDAEVVEYGEVLFKIDPR